MSQHWVEYAGEERRRAYPSDRRRRKRKRRRGGFLRRAAAVLAVIAVLVALKNVIGDHLILTRDGIAWSACVNLQRQRRLPPCSGLLTGTLTGTGSGISPGMRPFKISFNFFPAPLLIIL